jgi:lysophospholipase L1-like esterase
MRCRLIAGIVLCLAASLTPPASASTPAPGPAGSGVRGNGYLSMPRVQTFDCRTGPVGRRVLVLGDSITVFTKDSLTESLRTAGWSVCLDARRSQTTANALDYYAAGRAFPRYVDVIVMATGSNDIFDPAVMTAQVARARNYAGSRPLLWVTAWVKRTTGAPALIAHDLGNSVRVNAAERRHPCRAHVDAIVDWYAFLQARVARSSMYLTDGVHTSLAGGAARNALITAALARFRH